MKSRAVASLAVLATLTVAGCSDDNSPEVPEPASVQISPESRTFHAVGETAQFSAIVRDQFDERMSSPTLEWHVSDLDIARVDASGMVTTKASGTTYVTARSGSISDSAEIVVEQRIATFKVSAPQVYLFIGDTLQLEEHATDRLGNSVPYSIDWVSSDPDIASVDAEGRVVAMAGGKVTINATVTTDHETVQDSQVLYTAEAGGGDLDVTSISPSVLRPGEEAEITGSGFSPDPEGSIVLVADVEATVLAATASSLTIRLPSHAAFTCQPTHEARITIISSGAAASPTHPFATANVLEPLDVGEYVNLTDSEDTPCIELPSTDNDYLISVYNTTPAPTSAAAFRLRGESSTPTSPETVSPARRVASADRVMPHSRTRTVSDARAGHDGGLPAFTRRAPLMGHAWSSPEVGKTLRSVVADARAQKLADPIQARHLRILEANRELLEQHTTPAPHGGVAQGPVQVQAARTTARDIPSEGDTLELRVPDIDMPNDSLCSVYFTVSGRVVYAGDKAIIVEDIDADLAGTMDARYRAIGREYENDMHPIIEKNFGDPFAMDDAIGGMGRIVMLFSPTINDFESVAGFVSSTNLFPRSICPSSNSAQMFYAIAPTDTAGAGEASGSETWHRIIRSTVIHEVKHIVSHAGRIAHGGQRPRYEESWLEESTARIAEELWARTAFGYEQHGNTNYRNSVYCEVRPDWPECQGKPYAMLNHFDGLYAYMRASHELSPLGPVKEGEDWTFYGSGWFFVRWVLDHYAEDEAAFLYDLVQETSLAGVNNLLDKTGTTIEELLGPWSLSLYWDRATAPGLGHPSWNVQDIFQGMSDDFPDVFPERYPLLVHKLEFGSFDEPIDGVQGGSATIFTLSGAQNGAQMVELTDLDGNVAPQSLRISILRTR